MSVGRGEAELHYEYLCLLDFLPDFILRRCYQGVSICTTTIVLQRCFLARRRVGALARRRAGIESIYLRNNRLHVTP